MTRSNGETLNNETQSKGFVVAVVAGSVFVGVSEWARRVVAAS